MRRRSAWGQSVDLLSRMKDTSQTPLTYTRIFTADRDFCFSSFGLSREKLWEKLGDSFVCMGIGFGFSSREAPKSASSGFASKYVHVDIPSDIFLINLSSLILKVPPECHIINLEWQRRHASGKVLSHVSDHSCSIFTYIKYREYRTLHEGDIRERTQSPEAPGL